MIGGKITIKKHGQKDIVIKEHSENTNEAELMLVNPAVYKPKLAPAFPNVESITLKSISERENYKPIISSDTEKVEKVILRQNEEGVFKAKVKAGNVDLTSWVIYDAKGVKEFIHEQKGTEFQTRFLALGQYRVEGYGKPKNKEFEKGKYNKNYPSCSIDVEVVVNKLNGSRLQTVAGDTFTRDKIVGKRNEHRLRKDFPATFEATFVLAPNASEMERIKMYVTDSLGNILQDLGSQSGTSFTFVPNNSGAKYKVVAEYMHEDGVVNQQTFEGVTESLLVMSISNAAQIIRPETPMTFTAKTQYDTSSPKCSKRTASSANVSDFAAVIRFWIQ